MAVDTMTFTLVAVVYMAVLVVLGYLGYKRTKEADDFMLAGRKVHPVLIALSYGATFISTAAIIGFGGVAAQLGLGVMWLVFMNIALGIFIAFIVFGKRTRAIGSRLQARTFPDLLGKIYKSPFLRYASALIIVVGMPLYMSAVMIGGARFIEVSFSIDYNTVLLAFAAITALYVIIGGLLAVIYTDSLQGVIMLVGMTILLVATFAALGGIFSGFQALTDMADKVPAGLAAAGHNGWTAMPELGSSLWYTMVTTIIMGVGIGVLAQPQLAVRFMTAKDDKALNRAVPIGAVFILMMVGVAYTVGALSNVYFMEHNGQLATQVVPGGNLDMVIPTFINAIMPDWFVMLFMLTMLSAALSTMSALLHTMGTAIGVDVLSNVLKRKPSVNINRVGVLVMLIISVALAYIMPGSIIARATAMFMGLCAAAFLPAFTHALFSKNPSARGAKYSLVIGAVAWFLWTAFVHIKESQPLGISMLLFGKDAVLGQPWQVLDPLFIALPLSTITLAAFWWVDRQATLKNGKVGESEKATV
jgi:SSS family solute:Na+ symporter